MIHKSIAVFGVYRDRGHAEEAVDALRAAGFRNSDVSVLLPDQAMNTTARAAAAGGSVGGALGWLAGVGALAVPGVGPFIASGPILGALAGAGDETGVTGALTGMGIPKQEAARYEGRVLEGAVLLSVHCEDPGWVKLGMDVLRETSAKDVSFTGEAGAGSARVGKATGD